MAVVTADEQRSPGPGRRRAETPPRRQLLFPVLPWAAGAIVSGAAWFFLVRAAIDFGQAARGGQTTAWLFTGLATLGATVCLLLLFVLVARIASLLGLVNQPPPRRSAGRRAAR